MQSVDGDQTSKCPNDKCLHRGSGYLHPVLPKGNQIAFPSSEQLSNRFQSVQKELVQFLDNSSTSRALVVELYVGKMSVIEHRK